MPKAFPSGTFSGCFFDQKIQAFADSRISSILEHSLPGHWETVCRVGEVRSIFMKRGAQKIIPEQSEKKPRKRWLNRAFAVMDGWSADHKKLTLIYGSQNCRIQQNGRLAKFWKGTYGFINQSGLRVFLSPDEWNSLQFEENDGIVLVIDGLIGDGGFVLRESMGKEKDPDSIEIPNNVLSQLAYWVQQRTVLLMMFHRGLHTMAAICRATDLSEGRFMLLDETTLAIHVIQLDKCLKLQLRKSEKIQLDEEREVHSVLLWDAEQVVEIGHFRGTAEDTIARFTSSSDLIH